MSLQDKLTKLEKRVTPRKKEPPWLVIVYDESGKQSEALLEKAKAQYREEHPGYDGDVFSVIWVTSQRCKGLVERIISGEMPWDVKSQHEEKQLKRR